MSWSALRKESSSWKEAEEEGLTVMKPPKPPKEIIVMVLIPDQHQGTVYKESIEPNL
jgi:ketol-acid reductoisomerase